MLAKTDETEIIEGCAATPEQEDLRQAVRDWVAANSSSYKAAGRMSGVAESTFTAWLGATYKGNNAKIDEKVRVWLASERNFSRQKIAMPAAAPFVYTKTVGKIMAALEHAQAMPDIAVITGGAGVGKTRSILQYKTLYPNVWHLTARKSLSSAYSMMEYLRETLGVPETAPFRVAAAISLKLTNTGGLIVVDEAQHLRTDAFDELRSLHDLSGIGLAFVGNHGVWERMDGGGRKAEFAQLYSRVGFRVNIAKSTISDADDLLTASGIEDEKICKLLRAIAVRPGALRQMSKVLRIAQLQAIGAEETLNEKHVIAAEARLSGREAGL